MIELVYPELLPSIRIERHNPPVRSWKKHDPVNHERRRLRRSKSLPSHSHFITAIARRAGLPETRRPHVIRPGDSQPGNVVAPDLSERRIAATPRIVLVRRPVRRPIGTARRHRAQHKRQAQHARTPETTHRPPLSSFQHKSPHEFSTAPAASPLPPHAASRPRRRPHDFSTPPAASPLPPHTASRPRRRPRDFSTSPGLTAPAPPTTTPRSRVSPAALTCSPVPPQPSRPRTPI